MSGLKRAAIALVAGGVILSGIYGLAASLGVNSQSLGSGNASVAACQGTTLTASYATSYSSSVPGYTVGVVTVTGLDTTAGKCGNKSFKVELVNSSNTSLGEVTGTTPAGPGPTSFTADFASSNVLATNVTGVHVLITG